MQAMEVAVAYADLNDGTNITIAITDDAGVPVYEQHRGTSSPGTFDFAMAKNGVVVATGSTSAAYGARVSAGDIKASACRALSTLAQPNPAATPW